MNIFSGQSPKAIEIRAKVNPCDLIKLKSFCTAKETHKKTERQLTEWEKIVSNDATDKGLISRIYSNLYNSTAKKPIDQWKNGKKTSIDSSPRKIYRWPQTHEKMLNIADYKRNANQNHHEIPPHTSQNGHHS